MTYEALVNAVGTFTLSKWLWSAPLGSGSGHDHELAAARDAIAATLALLAECDEAVAILAAHFGAEAWMADPPNDARDALRDLAKWAEKSAVEAPTIPSKRRKDPTMGEDSGQIDAQRGKMGK